MGRQPSKPAQKVDVLESATRGQSSLGQRRTRSQPLTALAVTIWEPKPMKTVLTPPTAMMGSRSKPALFSAVSRPTVNSATLSKLLRATVVVCYGLDDWS